MNNVAFARTRSYPGRPLFVVDPDHVVRDTGRQIAWEYLDSSFDQGAVPIELAESVDIGETAIDVVALPVALPKGTLLDFGDSESGTVTASAAIQTATAVTVTALPRAMRSGEILDFGTSKEVQLTADANKGATSITVAALDTALAGGEVATVPVERMVLHLSAAAAAGATSITVDGADVPIENGQVAYFDNEERLEGKSVKAGTVMAELSDGRIVPRSQRPGSETAKYLLATNAEEDSKTDAITGYGIIKSAAVYENLLPEATGSPAEIDSDYKDELLAQGGFWMFEQYSDNTV